MSKRFFSEEPLVGERAWLTGSEADHLIRVLRAKPGDQVILFDNSGWEYPSRIIALGRSRVDLMILERRWIDREISPPLLLAVALPKGERQRWLVEKAVELGVTELIPLKTDRGVAHPLDRALQRLRRVVIEASKQCGRNRLMTICPPRTVAECLAAAPAECEYWLAHPGEGSEPLSPLLGTANSRPVLAMIGPEGGFSDQEIAACGPACRRVSLGPRTLRIETASLAMVSAISLIDRDESRSQRHL